MLASGSPAAQPTAQPPARASKRRLSDARSLTHEDDLDLGYEGGEPSGRSKRSRPQHNPPAFGATEIGAEEGGASTSTSPGSAGVMAPTTSSTASAKAISEKEKEQRRVARMIRNRNAAQASRDRKKELAAFLERRVHDLECLLKSHNIKVPTTFPDAAPPPPPVAGSSASSASSSPAAAFSNVQVNVSARTQRAMSVLSDEQNRVADLEDENDALRSQLHLEQVESAQLRSRLEEAEAQLARLAHLSALAPDAPFSPFSGTTTPLPAGFEPTFAFDTPNLCPLPQPEERADGTHPKNVGIRPLGGDHRGDLDRHHGGRTFTDNGQLSPRSTRGRPIPAAEAVPESVSRATPSPAASYAASLADIASTPPANESYLELDERVTVSPVWSDWAKGAALPLPPLPPLLGLEADATRGEGCDGVDAVLKPLHSHDGAEESALAFLDLSFLQDGPATDSS